MNRYHLFVDGQYYAAKLRNRFELDIDPWTNQPKMIPKHYAQRCVQPLIRLVDQVILYPEKRENPRHFLSIDPNPPIALTSVTVPLWLSEPFPITKAAVVSFCHSRFPDTFIYGFFKSHHCTRDLYLHFLLQAGIKLFKSIFSKSIFVGNGVV